MSGTHRLRDLTRAERTAVMEKAIELSERASVEDTEAWIAAAAEMGIDRVVLLEAQEAIAREQRRSEGMQTREEILAAADARVNRRHMGLFAIFGAGAIALVAAAVLAPDLSSSSSSSSSSSGSKPAASAPQLVGPFTQTVAAEANRWKVWSDSANLMVGTANVEGEPAVRLTLAPLSSSGIANYRTTSIHGDLSSLETLEIDVWSDGIERLQPSFRRSRHAQWSVPPVSLSPGENHLVIPLSDFRYQERAGKGKEWTSKGTRPLRDVEMFQIKVGKGINKPDTQGTLDLVRVGAR